MSDGFLSAMDYISATQVIPELAEPDDVKNASLILEQLYAYLKNPNIKWDIPLLWPDITPYRKKVCISLQKIKPGTTATYGELAEQLNSGARAVGSACRHNPFPIIFPCHRVVAKNGIGGYAGDQIVKQSGTINKLTIKRFLLEHEQNTD